VSFSITVPKFFTIEQLARQIEAEYAYLVEREVGLSRFPVIECGALFDHVELERPSRRRRRRGSNSSSSSSGGGSGARGQGSRINELQDQDKNLGNDDGGDDEEEDSEDEEEDEEDRVDERDEADSRGVQLRFSDRVEDVLERDSTVHVVNIDQGKSRLICVCSFVCGEERSWRRKIRGIVIFAVGPCGTSKNASIVQRCTESWVMDRQLFLRSEARK